MDLVVLEHLGQLFLLSLVFLDLGLGLISKPLECLHETFDLSLLVVELLHLHLVALILLDIFRWHHSNFLLQLIESWLLQRDGLALISLLLSELYVLLLLLLALSLGTWHGLGHLLLPLARHRGTLDELIMNGLDTLSE